MSTWRSSSINFKKGSKIKKIAIIGTVGLPAKYGGFETLTEHLTKHLSDDYKLTVYCSGHSYDDQPETHNGAALKYINLKANGIQSIPYDILSIFHAYRRADTLLILGVSGCIVLPFVKLFSHKKLVVNIDGLEWKRQKWNRYAKWFLKFSEKLAVKYADVVIADNKVIQDYVRDEYGKESELIAYGADHVKKEQITQEVMREYPFLSEQYAFTVCRIEPENNVHMIIEAVAEIDELPLVIIGNWKASQYGRDLKEKYADRKNIFLIEAIYDQVVLNQIRSNCTLYLHGHSAGGTNPSLVEAMHLQLPIFAYDVAYNRETTEHEARYFSSSAELFRLLEHLNELSLPELGKKMFEIAEKRYRWDFIAKQYAKQFIHKEVVGYRTLMIAKRFLAARRALRYNGFLDRLREAPVFSSFGKSKEETHDLISNRAGRKRSLMLKNFSKMPEFFSRRRWNDLPLGSNRPPLAGSQAKKTAGKESPSKLRRWDDLPPDSGESPEDKEEKKS